MRRTKVLTRRRSSTPRSPRRSSSIVTPGTCMMPGSDPADFGERLQRAVSAAAQTSLTGVLVTPGPDLVYFTGYQPTAITERITMLVLQTSREPSLVVPILERPDAEGAPGVAALTLVDWTDGSDPYAATGELLDPTGRYAISDSAWAMHVLGLQKQLPQSSYISM